MKLNYQTAEEVCRRLRRFRYRDHPYRPALALAKQLGSCNAGVV
jgi:hypothetical protein